MAGDGKQYVSWIHDADFLRAVYWLLERRETSGSVNLAAPDPLPNREFMAALRRAWGIRLGLPTSRWMLEVGAVFMRTETELLLKSRRVVPSRLLGEGFTFSFPSWPEAAHDLCARWRALRRGRPVD
jgi:NAD dependent epimerase/dehydratase family enzyme